MKTTQEILETNKKQKEFYNNFKQNFFTKLWAKFRNGILNKTRKNIGVSNQTYDLHRVWFGDLKDKKVLDLGCFSGNALSMYLAENSKSYLGIDLSDVAISKLSDRLKPYPNAKAEAIDFLSDEFTERNFDLVYAYGVLHHFPSTDILINRLNEIMSDNASIISYDPLETSWPVKLVRILYRPFQSDADWEWPFTKETIQKYHNAFDVIERRGILGKSKWVFVVNFLPISEERKKKIGQKWHQQDWEKSAVSDYALYKCMHLTMLMKKK
ncbi:class I SAM-dependent methyltransferase [Flavobacterium amnicola]|uniref:Class I SAM-dependent methyltransferase n=1 Tax=Flavobacterium amnicola TaxID=2506422 RepID=A0A4Q1K1E4_9FLAO|nr:class I SAM-dependent methyltransferase [Flavobacterium amnicola]RXR17746.1 class I SAM-dependent methyltransferase [Flavobacterium amnicola]